MNFLFNLSIMPTVCARGLIFRTMGAVSGVFVVVLCSDAQNDGFLLIYTFICT